MCIIFFGCFRNLLFLFIFSSLIMILRRGFIYTYPVWGSLSFLKLKFMYFTKFRKFLDHYNFEYFFLLHSVSSWDWNCIGVRTFSIVPHVPRALFIIFNLFSLSRLNLYLSSLTLSFIISILVISQSPEFSISNIVFSSVLGFLFGSYFYNFHFLVEISFLSLTAYFPLFNRV